MRRSTAIENEGLLANVRACRPVLQQDLQGGPGRRLPGCSDFLRGLRMRRSPRRTSRKRCSRETSSRAPRADPAILRLLPAFILKEEHIDLLRAALVDL
jgi:hypothetical protein